MGPSSVREVGEAGHLYQVVLERRKQICVLCLELVGWQSISRYWDRRRKEGPLDAAELEGTEDQLWK